MGRKPAARGFRLRARTRESISFYLFISPWIVGFLALTLGPMLVSLQYAFSDYSGLDTPRFIGVANFVEMVGDSQFWTALYNTIYFVFISVPLQISMGLLLAILLNQKIRGMRFFRTGFYLPSVMPGIASAVFWVWMFNPQYGIINQGLGALHLPGLLWLNSEVWSKPALIIKSQWGVGGGMVIFLAGLQGIPAHLYEAAQLDGAGIWSRFWNVTIPMMTPTIFFNLLMGFIGAFQNFIDPLVMTGGGPLDSSLLYVLYLYFKAFRDYRMGYASALAWVLGIIIMIFTIIQVRLSKRWVYYEGEARR